MKGRKRKPTKLHLVTGTAQKCRMNKKEPKAPAQPPRAPAFLSAKAAEWFGLLTGRLQALGIASMTDTENLMLAAERLEEIEELDAHIKENGRIYAKWELIKIPGENGQTITKAQKVFKSNPAVAQRSEAMRHLQSLLAEFGLSPASRPKVHVPSGEPSGENPWEDLVNS